MATALAEQPIAGAYISETAATQLTTVTWTDVDPTNMTSIVMSTGKVLLLVRNTDAVNPQWITVASSRDAQGRQGEITQYDLAASEVVCRVFEARGWEQTLGGKNLLIDGEANTIELLAIPI